MRSEISSTWTFLLKFVFPLPFVIFSFYVVSAWSGKSTPIDTEIPMTQPQCFLFVFFIPLLFVGFVIFLFGRVKRLRLDKDNLYISNYFKEIVVPVANIKAIEEYPGPRLKPTKIYFREATAFGTEIEFIPRDTFLPWRRSLVVAELRKLANVP